MARDNILSKVARVVARLPTRRLAQPLLAGTAAGSIALSGVTNRVSLVVFVLIGVMLLLFAWGILTGWASVWAEFAKDERKWAEGAEHLPLGRSRAGRGWIYFNRQDHESNRGFVAVGALLTAVMFIALGIAGIVGGITFDL